MVELELGHLYYFRPEHLFVAAYVLEQFLVQFKQVACIESYHERALS